MIAGAARWSNLRYRRIQTCDVVSPRRHGMVDCPNGLVGLDLWRVRVGFSAGTHIWPVFGETACLAGAISSPW